MSFTESGSFGNVGEAILFYLLFSACQQGYARLKYSDLN